MNRFRHALTGMVRVRLTGCSPERFFNLCGQGDVEIWNISCADHEYECCMTVQGFFACRPLAKKAGIRLKLLKKRGLPFFFYRNRKRKLWAAGFFSFFMILLAVYLGYRISGESAPLGPGTFKFSEDRGDFLRSAKGRD